MTGWMWVTLASVFLACFTVLMVNASIQAEKARMRESSERLAAAYTAQNTGRE